MYLTTRDGNQHLLNGMKTHAITALGMARTFQNIRLFSEMTVLENVMIGRHCRTHAGILSDEPAAGMNPQETNELKALIRSLRDSYDLSVLLIEHDMSMVMSLSDTIYVMEYGSPIASGTPEEIRSNPDVIKAYLGESHDA